MERVKTFLAGKKTYLVAAGTVLAGLTLAANGNLAGGIDTIAVGLFGVSIRAAILRAITGEQ